MAWARGTRAITTLPGSCLRTCVTVSSRPSSLAVAALCAVRAASRAYPSESSCYFCPVSWEADLNAAMASCASTVLRLSRVMGIKKRSFRTLVDMRRV